MHRRLPSLNALRAFEAAARHVSFSKAAEELFVTHAAISRQIRELETWLNIKLFHRPGRGVTLTQAGERYQRTLTPLFDRMASITDEISQSGSHELTVSVEPSVASRWLIHRLWDFQEKHPDIELNIEPTVELIDFRRHQADLAIRCGQGDWDNVVSERLTELVSFPVCSPELLEGQTIESPEDLKRFPLIHEESRQWWKEWLNEAGLDESLAEKGPKFQETSLALEAAEQCMGFALGDNILAADALEEGDLIRPFDIDLPEWGLYVVRPKGYKENAAVQAFHDWLLEQVSQTPRTDVTVKDERQSAD